jgi:hypothetical protein
MTSPRYDPARCPLRALPKRAHGPWSEQCGSVATYSRKIHLVRVFSCFRMGDVYHVSKSVIEVKEEASPRLGQFQSKAPTSHPSQPDSKAESVG